MFFIRTATLLFASLLMGSAFAQNAVSLWTVTDLPELWQRLSQGFAETHPEYALEFEERATDPHKEIMRQVINTPTAPDLYFMWGGVGLGGFFVNSGGVEPLDTQYEELGWAERFPKAALDAATFDGQLYGMPYRVRTMGLYYSKTAFEQAGITAEPTTYDELVEVNQKLVEAGITPLSVGGKFGWMTMRLVDSLIETTCGAEKHDALKAMETSWTEEPCVVEAYQELKRWIDEGWLPSNFLGIDPANSHIPVYTGEAAMMYEGDWMVAEFAVEGASPDDFGFFPFPSGTDRISFFTELLFLTNTTSNPEGALAFLDYLSSPETQEAFAGSFGTLSPTLGVTLPEDTHELVAEFNTIVAEASGIYLPGDQSLPLAVVNEYFRAQDNLIAGVISPEQAPGVVQTAIDAYTE